MCSVSNVGDYWKDQVVPRKYPEWKDYKDYTLPPTYATKQEVEQLRQDILALRALLEAALKFDESLGEPHCEHESKVRLIKEMAKSVGVDLGDLI